MQRVEALVQALEACPNPTGRESARELVRAVLELHSAGLARLLELVNQAGDTGRQLVIRLSRDDLVGSLLVLHGLHPVPPGERVAAALERLQPRLRTLEAEAELLQATGEMVRVRLRGNPAIGPTARATVEAAVLEAAPEIQTLIVEESWDGQATPRVALPLLAGETGHA
jgi:hypothetical protein